MITRIKVKRPDGRYTWRAINEMSLEDLLRYRLEAIKHERRCEQAWHPDSMTPSAELYATRIAQRVRLEQEIEARMVDDQRSKRVSYIQNDKEWVRW